MARLVYNAESGAMEPVRTEFGTFTPGVPVECHPRVYSVLINAYGFTDPDVSTEPEGPAPEPEEAPVEQAVDDAPAGTVAPPPDAAPPV